jgi:regulator of nucleoside diphosphate kinase
MGIFLIILPIFDLMFLDYNLNIMRKIIINRLDYARIKKCINDAKQFKSISNSEAEKQIIELDSAKFVEPEAIPSIVVL